MSHPTATRLVLTPASKPRLPRHAKLRHDAARDRWTILAPERVYALDAVGLAILKLCDGARTVDQIATELAQTYRAPKETILTDSMSMLQGLADKGVLIT